MCQKLSNHKTVVTKTSFQSYRSRYISWISLARVFSPIACRTSISVPQQRGLPFPPIHSPRISRLICSASSRYFVPIALTSAPVLSFRSRTPNVKYFAPICVGILMFPLLPGKFRSFNKLGLSPAIKETAGHEVQCRKMLASETIHL